MVAFLQQIDEPFTPSGKLTAQALQQAQSWLDSIAEYRTCILRACTEFDLKAASNAAVAALIADLEAADAQIEAACAPAYLVTSCWHLRNAIADATSALHEHLNSDTKDALKTLRAAYRELEFFDKELSDIGLV
jgi:hypothetical protein